MDGGNYPLHVAAQHGQKIIVEYILAQGIEADQPNHFYGTTPLCTAILNGDTDTAKLLVERGADINAVDSNGNSILMNVILSGSKLARDCLLQFSDINANQSNYEGITPLIYAAQKNQEEMVEFLCSLRGLNLDEVGLDGKSALWTAAEVGNADMVQCLLDRGARCLAPEENAGRFSNIELAIENIKLLDKSIDTLSTQEKAQILTLYNNLLVKLHLLYQGKIIIHNECAEDRVDEFKNIAYRFNNQENEPLTELELPYVRLKNYPLFAYIDAHIIDFSKGEILDQSVPNRDFTRRKMTKVESMALIELIGKRLPHFTKQVVEAEIQSAISTYQLDFSDIISRLKTHFQGMFTFSQLQAKMITSFGLPPILIAAMKGHLACVDILSKQDDSDVDAPLSTTGMTPLMSMCQKLEISGVDEYVIALVENGADINQVDTNGENALFWAIRQHKLILCKYLVTKGINVEHLNASGQNILLFAMQNSNEEMTRYIASLGINVRQADNTGVSPMSIAKELDEQGGAENIRRASVVWSASMHQTAYDEALEADTKITKIALDHLFGQIPEWNPNDVDKSYKPREDESRDMSKHTLLTYAIAHHYNEAVERLIDINKADVDFARQDGKTPFHVAIENSNMAVIKLLLVHEVEVNAVHPQRKNPLVLAIETGYFELTRFILNLPGIILPDEDDLITAATKLQHKYRTNEEKLSDINACIAFSTDAVKRKSRSNQRMLEWKQAGLMIEDAAGNLRADDAQTLRPPQSPFERALTTLFAMCPPNANDDVLARKIRDFIQKMTEQSADIAKLLITKNESGFNIIETLYHQAQFKTAQVITKKYQQLYPEAVNFELQPLDGFIYAFKAKKYDAGMQCLHQYVFKKLSNMAQVEARYIEAFTKLLAETEHNINDPLPGASIKVYNGYTKERADYSIYQGYTLLDAAISHGHWKVIEYLIQQGAKIDECPNNSYPAERALEWGQGEVFYKLTQQKFAPYRTRFALYYATCHSGTLELIDYINDNHFTGPNTSTQFPLSKIICSPRGYQAFYERYIVKALRYPQLRTKLDIENAQQAICDTLDFEIQDDTAQPQNIKPHQQSDFHIVAALLAMAWPAAFPSVNISELPFTLDDALHDFGKPFKARKLVISVETYLCEFGEKAFADIMKLKKPVDEAPVDEAPLDETPQEEKQPETPIKPPALAGARAGAGAGAGFGDQPILGSDLFDDKLATTPETCDEEQRRIAACRQRIEACKERGRMRRLAAKEKREINAAILASLTPTGPASLTEEDQIQLAIEASLKEPSRPLTGQPAKTKPPQFGITPEEEARVAAQAEEWQRQQKAKLKPAAAKPAQSAMAFQDGATGEWHYPDGGVEETKADCP